VIVDNYNDAAHVQGVYISPNRDATFRIEESILMRNGFDYDPASFIWPPSGILKYNIFNRNMYLSGELDNMNSGVFDSISLFGASGDQFRPGMKIERNFFYQGYVAMGAHGGYPDLDGATGTFKDNIIQRYLGSGTDDNRGQPGWGLDLGSGANLVEVSGNIITNAQQDANFPAFSLNPLGWYCYSHTFKYPTRNNLIFNNIFDSSNAASTISIRDGVDEVKSNCLTGWSFPGITGNTISNNILINSNLVKSSNDPNPSAIGTVNDIVFSNNEIFSSRTEASLAHNWTDSERTLKTYLESIGYSVSSSDGYMEFFNEAKLQRKGFWRNEFTSKSINTYIRDGFTDINNVVQVPICTPNWSCGNYSVCTNSLQTRSCINLNSCNINTNKPVESQSCYSPSNPPIPSSDPSPPSSSSSGGGGGGGSSGLSSFFDYVRGSSKDLCISNFKFSTWSACIDEKQFRERSDLNSCRENSKEIRVCKKQLDENSLRFLNAKKVSLEKFKDKIYNSKFSSGTQIIKLDKEIKNPFIVYNENEGLDYFAKLVDEKDGEFYYSVEAVDENLINSGVLEEEGIIEKSVAEDIRDSLDTLTQDKSYRGVIYAMLGLFFLTFVLGIVFYFRKNNEKKILERLHEANNKSDAKNTPENLSKTYSDEKVQRYEKYITEIKSYLSKHPELSSEQARLNLEKIGWNKEILDVVFKNE